jgi:hypothetical protein
MPLIELTSNLSRKDNPQDTQKIIGRPSPTAIVRDTARVTKFLLSPKGLLFIGKQAAQQLMNPNTEGITGTASIGLTKIYDPISPIANTIGAPLGLRTDRHWPPVVRTPLSTYEGIQNLPGKQNRLINLTNELILGKTTKIGNILSKIQQVTDKLSGFKGSPIQTLSGLTGPASVGGLGATTIRRFEDTTKANSDTELNSGKVLGDLGGRFGLKKEPIDTSLLGKYKAVAYGQMPERNHSTTIIDFRKIRDGKSLDQARYSEESNRQSNFGNTLQMIDTINDSVDESLIDFSFNGIAFKAYLGAVSDNFAPSWNTAEDQGRADPRYQYAGFERTVTFDFIVAAYSRSQLEVIWRKLQDLARMTYPVYGSEGFYGQTTNVTIGKLFDERPMIIQDLGYDWDNETPWEIDEDYQSPLYTTVSMTCVVLGDRPQSDSVLYDIKGLSDG